MGLCQRRLRVNGRSSPEPIRAESRRPHRTAARLASSRVFSFSFGFLAPVTRSSAFELPFPAPPRSSRSGRAPRRACRGCFGSRPFDSWTALRAASRLAFASICSGFTGAGEEASRMQVDAVASSGWRWINVSKESRALLWLPAAGGRARAESDPPSGRDIGEGFLARPDGCLGSPERPAPGRDVTRSVDQVDLGRARCECRHGPFAFPARVAQSPRLNSPIRVSVRTRSIVEPTIAAERSLDARRAIPTRTWPTGKLDRSSTALRLPNTTGIGTFDSTQSDRGVPELGGRWMDRSSNAADLIEAVLVVVVRDVRRPEPCARRPSRDSPRLLLRGVERLLG